MYNFIESKQGEPHWKRRRELIKKYPEIKNLFGYDIRQFYISIVVTIAQFAVAYAIQLYSTTHSALATVALILVTVFAFGAIANHWFGVVIHESSHNLAAKTQVQNRWIGIFCNLAVILPTAMSFRRYHLDHHTYLGIVEKDNDLPGRFEIDFFKNYPVMKAIWITCFLWFAVLARGFIRRPNRWEVTNIVIQMTVNVLIVIYGGWWAMLYLLTSTFVAYGPHPIAGHFIHEHYAINPEQETYSYYGPLNALTFNMGYHNEHHDFVAVPGSRLPELHRIAKAEYSALDSHTSWTGIMWTFITDSRLGHFSRFVRSRETFARARKAV